MEHEVQAYAKAHGMLTPVEEKNRCWRVFYSDEVSFHLDTLPCIAEEQDVIRAIAARGVPLQLAALAVAITDRRHSEYERISRALLSSNPGGFAAWFEERTRPSALARMRKLVEGRLYASVEDVPAYEWKTPLQRSIHILKRHRDVMFKDNPGVAPISMIITNLAAHAYAGEGDIFTAVTNILEKIPRYVNPTRPRVPNPADSAEDYADKWAKNPLLEDNFWAWHAQARADIAKVPSFLSGNRLLSDVRSIFRIELTQEELSAFETTEVYPTARVVRTVAPVSIPSAARPWGE
jgi:hypothetical protein